MGFVGAIFGSVLDRIDDGIVDTAYQVHFPTDVWVSDHYDRTRMEFQPGMERISLFDGTMVAFADPSRAKFRSYPQTGTVQGSVDRFDYVNEIHMSPDHFFCVYFLNLPKYYLPKSYIVPAEPHFAARVGERIRITWWFREESKIKIGLTIEKNEKKYRTPGWIDAYE